jgi:hypothetical protein
MKAEYEKRLAEIAALFERIGEHAAGAALARCPYKNRKCECTAEFGCRNQGKPRTAGGRLICLGDDKLDYRGAWQTS